MQNCIINVRSTEEGERTQEVQGLHGEGRWLAPQEDGIKDQAWSREGKDERGRDPLSLKFLNIYVPSPLSDIPERLPASNRPGLPQKNCFRL